MKFLLSIVFSIAVLGVKSQQSFRINDFPRIFKGANPNTFDKKINDTPTSHGLYKKPNYEISLVRANGLLLCSCLYKVGSTETSSSDSTVQTKVLEPVNDNCVKRYRNLVDRKLQ